MKEVGATYWRTDVSGNITVFGDGTTYSVSPELSATAVVYIPLVEKALNTTPIPTATTPAPTGNVDITTIYYNGAGSSEPDEYVQIKNNDSKDIQLQNWKLSDAANHVFTFPSFVMTPGQTCRVYTNENHPEWCGFDYGSGSAIWNNSGDTATLRDSNGTVIDTYSY